MGSGPRKEYLAMKKKLSAKNRQFLQDYRANCSHDWMLSGHERIDAKTIRAIYICEKCDSYTFARTVFVGWEMNTLENKFD